MKRALALTVLLLLSATAFALSVQPPAEPMRVGGPIPPPQKIKDVRPVYPRDAQMASVSGVVVIEMTIGEDGNVRNAVVLRSVPMLDQASLDCVRQWQFTPTVVNGKAVPVVMTVTVNFALGDPNPPPMGRSMQSNPPVRTGSGDPGAVRLMTVGASVWEIPLSRPKTMPHWNLEVDEPPLRLPYAKHTATTCLST